LSITGCATSPAEPFAGAAVMVGFETTDIDLPKLAAWA
jgi:hypothetical protein